MSKIVPGAVALALLVACPLAAAGYPRGTLVRLSDGAVLRTVNFANDTDVFDFALFGSSARRFRPRRCAARVRLAEGNLLHRTSALSSAPRR